VKRICWIALLCVVSIKAFASDSTLDLNVIGNGQKPILNVKTNLPPKTILMATLVNPVNQGGDGYVGQVKAAVSANQVAQFGPFSKAGDHLSSGIYQLTVSTIGADLQPEEVRAFFGMHGERLTGRQVSTLPGTSEKFVSQKFQFKINPDGSISNPPADEHTIGSTDDVWQKVQSDGREIYVQTNGRYFTTNPPLSTAEHHSGYGFVTYIVADLPESTIVGAPQSVMHNVEGNCETRHFSVLGSLFFAGKNRSGVAMHDMPPENIERTLVPNSPFEKAFDMLCGIAREQARTEGSAPITEPSPEPSDAGRSYRDSKQTFRAMGLCMACADNVAQWYVQRPASRCGVLAKHALEGDPAAVKELQTFPSFCTWEYK
jgi:hypothetical protein